MGWKVFADAMPNPNTFFQYVKFNENTDLICVRSRFVFVGNPTFTQIGMEIYSLRAGLPHKLLIGSSVLTKAQSITLANGIKELYFKFRSFQARKGETYAMVPSITGYSPSSTSHIAWKRAWPDPIYTTGYDYSVGHINTSCFDIHFIGAEE